MTTVLYRRNVVAGVMPISIGALLRLLSLLCKPVSFQLVQTDCTHIGQCDSWSEPLSVVGEIHNVDARCWVRFSIDHSRIAILVLIHVRRNVKGYERKWTLRPTVVLVAEIAVFLVLPF